MQRRAEPTRERDSHPSHGAAPPSPRSPPPRGRRPGCSARTGYRPGRAHAPCAGRSSAWRPGRGRRSRLRGRAGSYRPGRPGRAPWRRRGWPGRAPGTDRGWCRAIAGSCRRRRGWPAATGWCRRRRRYRCRRGCRIAGRGQVEQAGADEQVGTGTVRQRRVLVRQAAAFAFGEMDAMGEHAAFADQAGAMIDVQVVLRLGKQLADPGDFLEVLRKMGVQVDAGILVQQARRRGQLLGRGGRREARGDRVLQAPVAVPALDQRAARRSHWPRYRTAPAARCGPSAPCRRSSAGGASARPGRMPRRIPHGPCRTPAR